jgi:hypothetical protein
MLEPFAMQLVVVDDELRPPGSISVAPSGIPVPLDPIEPGTPSGDVGPIAGVVVEVCACAAPQLSRIADVITSHRRIGTSCRYGRTSRATVAGLSCVGSNEQEWVRSAAAATEMSFRKLNSILGRP